MSTYTTEKNNRKVKRYRLRKKLKEQGYTEQEIAHELELLDEELGYEAGTPGHDAGDEGDWGDEESPEPGSLGGLLVYAGILGVLVGVPIIIGQVAHVVMKKGA